ncbi:flagellar protein FliT [Enterobacter roggenkampii]|uniref:flagellar protein FliT n=1 Tax=Enterobacter roggenkampii TaxID=1812935 RepID=UPI003899D80B|nr:flagellar protein FliT [Enterobacter roggenkampii]
MLRACYAKSRTFWSMGCAYRVRKCITFNWWKRYLKTPIMSCPPAQVEQARALLEMILENENALKALLKVRMDELRNLIDQTGKQQSITSTYGKLSGNILYPESLTRDTQL